MTKYEDKQTDYLKKAANKALSEMPIEAAAEAIKVRAQLYNWLITMDERVRDPGKVMSDAHADFAANALEVGLQALIDIPGLKGPNAAAVAMLEAFKALGDEDQLNLSRHVLAETMRHCGVSAGLVSRNTPYSFWENTGFHYDGDVRAVFAKAGTKPGQPIGFDDGTHYVGTQSSKTLWLREFGLSIIFPFPPAFEVSRELDLVKQVMPDSLLDKSQLAQIDEILGWFTEDVTAYRAATTDEARTEIAAKIKDTIKLARLRIPQFNKLLDLKLEQHPEMGAEFENTDPLEFIRACAEWFTMKRDEARVASTVEGTSLLVRDQKSALLQAVMAKLSSCIPAEGKEPVVDDTSRALAEACVAFPVIRDAVTAAPDLLKQLEIALLELQKLVG